MGSAHPRSPRRLGGDPCSGGHREERLISDLESVIRSHWWSAVAAVARATGRVDVAEDSVQDACVAATEQWNRDGVPANPPAWLISVARRKAIDHLRRESLRETKERAANVLVGEEPELDHVESATHEDQLSLLYLCCHPALNPPARIALTLRLVCGLSTREIAAAFIVPEATMGKRLARAKQKIREAGILLKPPPSDPEDDRNPDVLRTIYLMFSAGHRAATGDLLVRPELCSQALRLARDVSARFPSNTEASGLLALVLLTDARRPARSDPTGGLVLLEEQDRTLWDRAMIDEGEALLTATLAAGRPGPFQLWAAIAACHSIAAAASQTDWRQISLLYSELLSYEPSPVVEANRAIAVAMAEGPAAGLTILDVIVKDPQLSTWPAIHIARADLLARAGRNQPAIDAYRTALELEPTSPERAFIARRIRVLQEL